MEFSLEGARRAEVLLVDDTPANLQLLAKILQRAGYATRSAQSGEAALESALQQPPDLILLDITMPGLDGYETCRRLRALPSLADTPVLFISALTSSEEKVLAFQSGGVDFISKPFHNEEVIARVGTHLELRHNRLLLKEHNTALLGLVARQVREISDSQLATLVAISKLAENRDDDTGKHIERAQQLCMRLSTVLAETSTYGAAIDREFVRNIYYASPLHDIGKVAIRDSILLKPGKLDAEEWAVMKTHAQIGARTLLAVHEQYPHNSFIAMGIEIAQSHHEKWDGKGYPDGLAGDRIPLCARIMAVADVYDALRSERCYKEAFTHEASCRIIFEGSGSHFDPLVVQAFATLLAGCSGDLRHELETAGLRPG